MKQKEQNIITGFERYLLEHNFKFIFTANGSPQGNSFEPLQHNYICLIGR